MHAETKVELDDEGTENFLKFIDSLEEVDDVQNVYTNAKYPQTDN